MKPIIYLVLLSVVIPPVILQCSVSKALPYFRRSVYDFTLALTKNVAEEQEYHFVSSALSPYVLLATLAEGATEQTLEELARELHLHPHKCFNNKFFEIVNDMSTDRGETIFRRGSAIFVDRNYELKKSFKNYVTQVGASKLKLEDFVDTYNLANTINSYASDATEGHVDTIVQESDLDNVKIVLIDALYFKGSWTTKFDKAETEESPFYDSMYGDVQLGDVSLMFGEIKANYTVVDPISASVLELPYESDDRYSMLIFLPNVGINLQNMLEKMKMIGLNSIFTLFERTGPSTLIVQIPRFKIESDLDNMKEWLEDMGLRLLFSSQYATFPNISDQDLHVSDIKQKATIEVNEEGSEASASTVAILMGRSFNRPVQFTANRPFLYMIVDRQLQLPLFVGAYSKPSVDY